MPDLFAAKLAEIGRHLDYLRAAYTGLRAATYPSLAERLRLRLEQLDAVGRELADLEAAFAGYRPPPNPALDTWPQLFAKLRILAIAVQSARTDELPAYLAAVPDESFFATVFEALHREVGLVGVHPVVSLQQPHWFAVFKDPPTHPLYLAPESLVGDPGELPLVFHEIGHVLFRLWDPDFPQHVTGVFGRTLQRQTRAIAAVGDPQERAQRLVSLQAWVPLIANQLEELVCDVVGALLGGPTFAVALAVGLFVTATKPFDYEQAGNYPPLDCRMRVIGIVLRGQGLDDTLLADIETSWAQVCAIPGTAPPRHYGWLYDDTFLTDIVMAVTSFLVAKGVQPYHAGCGGLRERLAEGSSARLADAAAYRAWATDLAAALRRDYSPSQSSSSSPSPGSSA